MSEQCVDSQIISDSGPAGFPLTGDRKPLRLADLHKFQIVSLWDMRSFLAADLTASLPMLINYAAACLHQTKPESELKENGKFIFGHAMASCESAGLRLSSEEAKARIRGIDVYFNTHEMWVHANSLCDTIRRECDHFQFLVLSSSETDIYREDQLKSPLPVVLADLTYDLSEAAKCLALNRTTACVFHLCLSMEFATEKLRSKAGAGKGPNGTMGDMVTEIEKVVKDWAKNGTKPKDITDKHSAAIWHLRSFVKGMRNQELHKIALHEVYKQEEANALYHTVKMFLEELAPLL